MANTADATNQAASEETAPKKSRKKLFILVGGLLVVAAIGAGAYFFLTKSSGDAAHDSAATEAQLKPAIFIDLPPMIINLVGQPDRPQYLRINLALEVASEQTKTQVEPLMPRIMDAFQIQLRQMRVSDFEGAAGVYRLKEELLRRVNTRIYPARVESVLIKELLLQ